MGIVSMMLGTTGLVAWIFPPLGFPISGVGLILGILALLRTKEYRKKAITGIITGIIGLVINIGVVVVLIVAGSIIKALLLGNT